MNTYISGQTLDQVAINRIQTLQPKIPYFLCFSGGKDSTVLLHLARRANANFDVHHHFCPLEPPELRNFAKRVGQGIEDYPLQTLAEAAEHHAIMPHWRSRWCCGLYKEAHGHNRILLTGIRWEESHARAKRQMVETLRHGRRTAVNPIIDWTTTDVWTYIREFNLPYCELYDQGWKRLGCVGCPLAANRNVELERWPAIRTLWQHVAQHVYKAQIEKGKPHYSSWQETYNNWARPMRGKRPQVNDCPYTQGQMELWTTPRQAQ
jgi:phosphoadenosine phosphosulfate reductase